MKKNIIILLLLFTSMTYAQYPQGCMSQDELEEMLKDLSHGYISVGNACGDERYMELVIDGDMDMDGNTLEILHADIKVMGSLVNEGEIVLLYDSAIFEVFDETLDTDDFQDNSVDVTMYPNPTTDYVNINADNLESIIFYDINGRVVKNFRVNTSRNKIFVGNLSSGAYIIVVSNTLGHTETLKLIKK